MVHSSGYGSGPPRAPRAQDYPANRGCAVTRPQLEIEPAFGDWNNNCVLVRIDVLVPYSDDVDSSTRADIEFY